MDRPGHCIETYSAGSTRQSKGQLVRGPAEIIYDQALLLLVAVIETNFPGTEDSGF